MSRAFEQPLFHGTVEMISRIDVLRGRAQKVEDVRMTPEKARVAIGNAVVGLTRYVMTRDGVPQDVAYSTLYRTELFKLLSDPETRLFLEDDEYLRQAYEMEATKGVDLLYEFIKPDP